MSKRDLITHELDRVAEQEAHADAAVPTLAAESALAKDWLTPGEDEAWANL